VEAVDVGAVDVGVPALLGVAPHPQVAVGDAEQRLRDAELLGAVVDLDQPPRVELPPAAVHRVVAGRGAVHRSAPGRSSARSETTIEAPASRSASPAPRSTPTTTANPPATPARTPETASSSTTASGAVTPSALAACRNVSGAGLPGNPSSRATRPSTTV